MSLLRVLAAVALGLFAGANLAEGGLLVPYWRSLPAAEFFTWYAANDERLYSFFSRLTILTAVPVLAVAVISWWKADSTRWLSICAGALLIGCIVMFPLYFEAANSSFSAAAPSEPQLADELARWSTWHWVRTVMAMVAFVLTVLAARTRD
ncbi:MAG TPA: DUF1772 domain-containing protein [Candidatus Binatia bacterium]|nr:DUF1772 domain-containing protein [Candidatus Binatia bacterium]